ncbi:MAG: hypothetical protein KDA92_03265 [Planctomycetales bacterium]|nr:hypothetical protein [Planctomycetales bacterium]MCA9166770.1 hypothetical protein [Planctomycetales bacterium]
MNAVTLLAPLFATTWFNRMWYSMPLVVVISLVYGATRHELMRPIIEQSVRFGIWILVFMVIVFVVLTGVTAMID